MIVAHFTVSVAALTAVLTVRVEAASPRAAAPSDNGLAQALAVPSEAEDGDAACHFRQLRGELRPAEGVGAAELAAGGAAGAAEHNESSALEPGHAASQSTGESSGNGIIPYPANYCKQCGEMAFCHRAGNPGCGGWATGGVASFFNRNKGHGCPTSPILTIPRSFIKDFSQLRSIPGNTNLLSMMLTTGFQQYMSHHGAPPVWQCIHRAKTVSVRWLHLHTFCSEGKVDGLPSHGSYCAKMYSPSQAYGIAAKWLR